MIRIKPDLLRLMSDVGFSSYVAKETKLCGPATVTSLMKDAETGRPTKASMDTLNTMCIVLKCGIQDILEYVPDDQEIDRIAAAWSKMREAHRTKDLQEEVARLRARVAELEAGMGDGSAPGDAQ